MSINKPNSKVTFIDTPDYYAFLTLSVETNDAFILYPSGLIDAAAYAPLMSELAKKNVMCFIVKMPLDLAVFNGNGADQVIADYQNIQNWYIGGHSLGGVMAAQYADEHPEIIKGIALMGSYTTKDLADQEIKVVSIYGSNDTVLNQTSYHKAKVLLPDEPTHYTELVIEGGNHASFGNYGIQPGDGPLDISIDRQQELTLEALEDLIHS